MTPQKVLVVDDDNLICWALQKKFASLALTARFVGNAREALAELRDDSCDLIFLDINLPDGNGIDLLDEIRKVAPNARIVILSADASEENRRRAIAGGVAQFIEKPFEISDIHKILRTEAGDVFSKRKSPRYLCRVPVRISIVTPVPEESGFDPHNLAGLMADVGAGGLRIHTEYPLRAGQRVRARIEAESDPLSKFLPPRGIAEVVWVELEGGEVTAGLRFLR